MLFFIPLFISLINYRFIESCVYLSAMTTNIIRYKYDKPYGGYIIKINRLYNLLEFIGSESRFVMSSYIVFEETTNLFNECFNSNKVVHNDRLKIALIVLCYICGYTIITINKILNKVPYGSKRWKNLTIIHGLIDLVGSVALLSISN